MMMSKPSSTGSTNSSKPKRFIARSILRHNGLAAAFIDGQLAIAQYGYWFSSMLRSDPKTKDHLDDYMMLPAPVVDGGNRYSPVTGGTGAIILKQSKHPDEAFKFLEWYMAGKPADDRAKSG